MKDKDLDKAIVDTLGEKLLEEFKEIGVDYPNFAAMFIDMVGIVSHQNSQIKSISEAMQDIVLEINKMREFLKEKEWASNLPRTEGRYLSDSVDNISFYKSRVPIKKEDLN